MGFRCFNKQVNKLSLFFRIAKLSDDRKSLKIEKIPSIDFDSLNNIKKTVGLRMEWEPTVYKKLYLDDFDTDGLLFWYNTILEEYQEKED